MIEVAHQKCIQICVSHKCPYKCSNCSQSVPHIKKPETMPLDEVERALETLVDYPGHIGMFGGEPTMHPQFKEICKLYQKYIPVKTRRGLWTAGYKWDEYKDIIHETFYPEQIAYNEHQKYQPCWHQPIHIAILEVIEEATLRRKIIDNCWVQQRWSAVINTRGAYFCEVAGGRAIMLGSPEGLPVEKGWWKRPLEDYKYQIYYLCNRCSACLPMPMRPNDKQEWDDCSPGMYSLLQPQRRKVYDIDFLRKYYEGYTFEPEEEYDKRGYFKDFPNWRPNRYRNEKKHEPDEG